ncbi:unnamed protein product [Caenorhabditis nigoni]
MRIRSYPSLINRQIIQEMDSSANFMLSKTSKKMKSLVKNNIYKVDQVWIDLTSNVTFVVEIDGKIYKVLVPGDDPALRGTGRHRFSINTVVLHSVASYDYREIISNHNYICEIFKCESNKISVCHFPKEFHEVDMDVENPNRILMYVDFCILRLLGSPSRICTKVPNLLIDDAKYHVAKFMNYFEGKNIVLKDAWLNDGPARIFILNWMLKIKENLVSFIAFQNRQEVFNESSVVNLLNSKRNATIESRVEDWDPEKRERFFKIADHHVFPADTFDCEHGYDIVREDGKRATVKVSPNHFMFFAWP